MKAYLEAGDFKSADVKQIGPNLYRSRLDILCRKYFTLYTFKNSTAVLQQVDQYGVDFRDQFNHTPLMLAARFGNAALVAALCNIGADTEQVNNNGLNAFQLALEQACVDHKFATRSLTDIYALLALAEITLQVDGRLLKLLRHTMEYTLLSIMIASFHRVVPEAGVAAHKTFNASGLTQALAHFPDEILPAHRKKQTYISAMLSKNERCREDRYNRKIFKRVKRGQYIINPDLSIRVQDQWVNIYSLIQLDQLAHFPNRQLKDWEWERKLQKRYKLSTQWLVDYIHSNTDKAGDPRSEYSHRHAT